MLISPVIPIRNREGLFAVLSERAATKITKGYMKLYATTEGVVVEMISRSRVPLTAIDPGARIVFFAIDQEGRLVTELGA